MATRQSQGSSLESRQTNALKNLRETYGEFKGTLEQIQRQADRALRAAARREGIPYSEEMLDNPQAKRLLKAHVAAWVDLQGRPLESLKLKEACSEWAAAVTRAVRVGVFPRHSRAGRVLLSIPASIRDDPAAQAACQWVAIRQYSLGNRKALRRARSGLERGVKDTMTENERKIAAVAFTAIGSGRRGWAVEAQRVATSQRLISRMSRQAFHQMLRRLRIPNRSPIQITPLRLTLRRPRP